MAVLVRGGDWRLRRHGAHVKRTALRRQSPKAKALSVQRRAFVSQFLEGRRCEMFQHSPCFGPLTVHESIARSHLGAIVPGEKARAQGQTFHALCAHHNTWCEDNPREAKRMGLKQ